MQCDSDSDAQWLGNHIWLLNTSPVFLLCAFPESGTFPLFQEREQGQCPMGLMDNVVLTLKQPPPRELEERLGSWLPGCRPHARDGNKELHPFPANCYHSLQLCSHPSIWRKAGWTQRIHPPLSPSVCLLLRHSLTPSWELLCLTLKREQEGRDGSSSPHRKAG